MDVQIVVLQSVQPLTTDLDRGMSRPVRVLTDGVVDSVVRAGVAQPRDVVTAPRAEWLEYLRCWAMASRIEVVTNDEYCLEDCARLRSRSGLARRQPSGVSSYLDKVKMKRSLGRAGVEVPRWSEMSVVPSPDGAPTLPDGLGYPVVVKPRQEANSRGVRVIRDVVAWLEWVRDREGQRGWEVEEYIDAPMYFMDGVVDDGTYTPALLGAYLGPLLPRPGISVLGAVEVPRTEPLWNDAADLGAQVAGALGMDGRFVTHLEFFRTSADLVVMEVCARAPGALVSEMARVSVGVNLELVQLRMGAGEPAPALLDHRDEFSGWVSVLARPDQDLRPPPLTRSHFSFDRMQPSMGTRGRYVSAMALLQHREIEILRQDMASWQMHDWFTDHRSPSSGSDSVR